MIGLGNSVVKRKLAGASVPAAPVNIVQPSLSGSGEVGEAVICNKGTWSGSPTPTYSYDFRIDSVSVQNGSSNSYTPLLADDGKTLTCLVTATNSQGSASEGTSNSLVIGVAPSNTVAPTLSPSGTQSTGTVITVGNGTFAGTAPLTYAYRWKRNGSIILGETANTYTIVAGDDGTVITAEVKATNAYGESAYIGTSNQVDAVNAVAPVNTVAPVISGTAVVGQTLSTTDGTWTGIPTPTYSYQWYRGATLISGATNSTYTLVQDDAGNTSNIKCVVTATNSAGSASADSNTVARILDTLTNTYITGLTLTSTEIDSFNTLYLDIRSNSYHTIIDNMMIYATATSAAALKPLFGSNTITPVNSPTWSRKVGYTHTGTSYINRGTSSNVNFTRDNHCFMVGFANKNTTTNGANGGITGAGAIFITPNSSANLNIGSCALQISNVYARTISNKDYAILRQSSTQTRVYQDGVAGSLLNSTTNGAPPTLMFDGGYNSAGTPVILFESGAISEYSLQGSGAIDPSVMRTIIRNFINSL